MTPEVAARKRMTLEEFWEWDSGDDRRYELIDGVPVAMSYPQRRHRRIVANTTRRVATALDHRPPCAAEAEAGIISPTRENTFYVADLAVSCAEARPDQVETVDPILIVEVLSPTTETHDRKVKLVEYRKIPSVKEILLVDSSRLYCEVHRRLEGDQWLTELVVDLSAEVKLESIGAALSLTEIYANVIFDEDEPEGEA